MGGAPVTTPRAHARRPAFPIPFGAMFERTALPDGPRVISARLPGSRSVTIEAHVLAGSRHEGADQAGCAHFMEHLTFKGTRAFPTTRALSEAVEGIGGTFNASTDRESTVYYVPRAGPPRRAGDAGPRRARRRARSSTRTEIEQERDVIVEEIRSYLDDPAEHVNVLFDLAVFDDTPLGREIAGTEESVRALPADAIHRFWRTYYRPGQRGRGGLRRHRPRAGRRARRPRPSGRATAPMPDLRAGPGDPGRRACSCGRPGRPPRRSSSSASRACVATTPTSGRCRCSTPSSATACRAGSSWRCARSAGWPTTSGARS